MESETYYTTEGDIVYIRVRSPHGSIRAEEQEWGLSDYDEESGELVGLEVWSTSKVLPRELIDALPRLDGHVAAVARQLALRPAGHGGNARRGDKWNQPVRWNGDTYSVTLLP